MFAQHGSKYLRRANTTVCLYSKQMTACLVYLPASCVLRTKTTAAQHCRHFHDRHCHGRNIEARNLPTRLFVVSHPLVKKADMGSTSDLGSLFSCHAPSGTFHPHALFEIFFQSLFFFFYYSFICLLSFLSVKDNTRFSYYLKRKEQKQNDRNLQTPSFDVLPFLE